MRSTTATVASLVRKRSSASTRSVASWITPRSPPPAALGGCPGNHGGCGERSGGCERRARSSLLRRAFRHGASVVAALAALAPRLVRLARHVYPDRLLPLLLLGLGHHVGEREAPAVALARQVGLHVGALLALAQRLDGEADAFLARVDAGDLGLDRVARLVERRRLVDALGGELRDVHQPLDPLLQLDEHTEVGDARDRALDTRAGRVALRHLRPRVLDELLDAERDALVVDVDAQHDRLDLVTLLVELRGVLHLLGPVQVGDVHQAVDVLLHLDEEAEVGDALDAAAELRAHRVVHTHQLPGVRLGLLEPERDAAVGGVDVEHLDLDLLPHLEHLRGMRHALGPRHLGDVDQSLDAPLDLDEGAVIGEADDLAADARVDRQALGDGRPRIGHDLLHAERDALALRVVLEDDHLHAIGDVDDLGGMPDAAPRHVGHVEEPVDAAEIDERAVVGDVLDRALEDDALLQHLQGLGLERGALALEDRSPGNHHVPARAVELEDGEAAVMANVAVEVARRPEIGVRAGEERGHADVHLEPALHLADDRPFDRTVALEGLLDLAPDLELLRLLPREDDVARLGVARLEVDVDLVALVHGELALARGELVDRDGALGLVADVDRHRVAPDEDYPAGDDLALLRLLQAPLEEGTKVLFGADLAIGLLRRLGHQGATPCGRDSLRNAGEPSLHTPVPRGFQERRQKLFAGLDPAHHIAPASG